LNIYKYILESYYGATVASMHFVVLHPKQSKYVEYEVANMQKEVAAMLKELKG
jgi:hypothetical protein